MNRGKIQFSLRTAMICLALFTLVLGWCGSRYANLRQRRAAVREIRGMGGRVSYYKSTSIEDRALAKNLEKIGLGDFNDRVIFVAFHGADSKRWTPKELHRFGEDARPDQLSHWNPWTQENVSRLGAHLQNLPHVRGLSFCRTAIPPHGLKVVAKLTNLRRLDLSDTQITSQDMQYLAKMKDLELLGLQQNPIDDRGIVDLRGLSQLSHLDLGRTEIGDESLIHISELSALELLYLEHTNVTDEGVKHLSGLTKLTHLDLAYTNTSDQSVEHLAKLNRLKKLTLGKSFTEKGVRKLKETLPDCWVSIRW